MAESIQVDVDRDGLGDTCDPNFCFVVFGNQEQCLDPASVLKVYVPELLVEVGQQVRLPFFVNRDEGQQFTYEWRILESPSGSGVRVQNPTGETALNKAFESLYEDAIPTLKADRGGDYSLEVTVTTKGADPVTREVGATAKYVVDIHANSGDSAGGCSVHRGASDGALFAGLMLLGLVLPLLRRRSRSRS
jgi:hypothetical protein